MLEIVSLARFGARWEINQGGHFAFGTHVAASKNLQKASGRCPGVFKCAVGFLPDLLGFFCDGFSAAADKFPRPRDRKYIGQCPRS